MSRLNTIIRLAACLAFLGVGAMLLTGAIGLVPSTASVLRRQRVALCDSLALFVPETVTTRDWDGVEGRLAAIARKNPEIKSIGVRDSDGRLLADIDNHATHWTGDASGTAIASELGVQGQSGRPLRIEIQFDDASLQSVFGEYSTIPFEVMFLAGSVSFVLFFPFLRRVLEEFDPAKIVPSRVRCALDSLAEGLLLLDNNRRIVLANRAFADLVDRPRSSLAGLRADDLPWVAPRTNEKLKEFPWHQVLRDKTSILGETLGMNVAEDDHRIFLVNSAPIVDDDEIHRGVLVSIDDVTDMESKKFELSSMVSSLQESQLEVQRKNRELQSLANCDALTGCLNRRYFFEEFQRQWVDAERYEQPLSVIMVDVDNFKNVNDHHGHAAGDKVLQEFGRLLREAAPHRSLVARYGGEEFSITLVKADAGDAMEEAERIRCAIAEHVFGTLRITASVGVSSRSCGGCDPQQMLEQADKALYVAKRSGRNRVVGWDQQSAGEHFRNRKDDFRAPEDQATPSRPSEEIPFSAVTALLSTLAYRDVNTASHSLRVADLCAVVARRLLTVRDAYILEVAALLHDIGKVGVPDAILLKPGKLSADEWETMRMHGRIGIEIVRSSFANEHLTELIRWHHQDSRMDAGDREVPVGAQILAVADAFDSMTSSHVYRDAKDPGAAIAELRRCSGTQFDAEIVECFIDAVQNHRTSQEEESGLAPKQVALAIGREVETIAHAVDEQDLEGLDSLTKRLQSTAAKNGLTEISNVAGSLNRLLDGDPNLLEIIETTHELLDMCRAMQHIHVRQVDPNQAAPPPARPDCGDPAAGPRTP